MKLVFAIINDDDFKRVTSALIKAELQSTRLSSSGGFLKSGNSTLLICVEDSRLDECIDIIRSQCRQRKQILPASASAGAYAAYPVEINVGGATVFVTDVDRFEKF